MKRTKITDNVYYIEPRGSQDMSGCAALVVGDSPRILIDAQMDANGPVTEAFVREEGPDIALITHYHLDHSSWLNTALDHGCGEVVIPAEASPYLTDVDYFVSHTAGPHGLGREWRYIIREMFGYRPLSRYDTFDSMNRFRTGGTTVERLATPGHTPGHGSFYLPEEKILFSGDVGLDRFGPWYGWPDCSLTNTVASILRLKALPVNVLVTSHGGLLSEGIDRAWQESLAHIVNRESRIREVLDAGGSREELLAAGVFYPNKERAREPMRSFLALWESIMVDQHLAVLEGGSLERLFPGLALTAGMVK